MSDKEQEHMTSDLEAERRLTDRNAEIARSLMAKVERAEQDARVAWDAHVREKAAREGWVKAYQDALARAERAEANLDDIHRRLNGEDAEQAGRDAYDRAIAAREHAPSAFVLGLRGFIRHVLVADVRPKAARSCNEHADCDAADQKWRAEFGKDAEHCNDADCGDHQ